jgi:hypothetical protein
MQRCIGGGPGGQRARQERLDNWWAQTRWRMMLVGQRNSTMFLHRDDIETATWCVR